MRIGTLLCKAVARPKDGPDALVQLAGQSHGYLNLLMGTGKNRGMYGPAPGEG